MPTPGKSGARGSTPPSEPRVEPPAAQKRRFLIGRISVGGTPTFFFRAHCPWSHGTPEDAFVAGLIIFCHIYIHICDLANYYPLKIASFFGKCLVVLQPLAQSTLTLLNVHTLGLAGAALKLHLKMTLRVNGTNPKRGYRILCSPAARGNKSLDFTSTTKKLSNFEGVIISGLLALTQ